MRTTPLLLALISSAVFAQNKTIDVIDDVGVGDHFPSHVPGTGPYRLPERDPVQRPESVEKPASEPGEWALPVAAPAAPAAAAVAPAAPAAPAAAAPPAAAVPAVAPATVVAVVRPAPSAPEAISADLEQAALERASNSLLEGSCQTQLAQLAELLDRSDRADTKARARVLRARCFTQRAKTVQSKVEYQLYLRDFPSGRWASEARDAVAER